MSDSDNHNEMSDEEENSSGEVETSYVYFHINPSDITNMVSTEDSDLNQEDPLLQTSINILTNFAQMIENMSDNVLQGASDNSSGSAIRPGVSFRDLFRDISPDDNSQNRNRKCELCSNSGQIVSQNEIYNCPHCIDRNIIRDRVEAPVAKPSFPCEICGEFETSVVFDKCKHLAGCDNCIKIVNEIEGCYKCPKCNDISETTTRVFI